MPFVFSGKITGIANKELVTAIARQRHGDMFPGQLREEQRRQLTDIGKRFVIDLGHSFDQIERRVGGCRYLDMFGSQVLRNTRRAFRFIKARIIKADGERLNRIARNALGDSRHRR